MAIDFPNSPSPGATFTANSKTWTFTNGKWVLNVSVGGVTGPAGVAIQGTAPATTDILWVDTSDTGLVIVPVGGTTGQVLAKSSGTDYATTWATPVTSGDMALKADLASPTFTGTPTLPTGTIATTQTAGNSSTAVATTAFVGTAVANLVDSAPATLNTLDELALALGDDANFATPTATAIGLKAPLVSPSFTTPALGVATATSVNGTTIPTSKTLVVTTDKLSVLAATTSAELAGVISDETGTGSLVFSASPALTGTPTAPTAAVGTNTTQIATTEFVQVANPTGAVIAFAGSSAPSGWFLCGGQEVAIASYGALHAVIGTTYGSLTNGSGGAGTTHFRVPDLRGRTVAGIDNMTGSDAGRLDIANSSGVVVGSQYVTLTGAQSGVPVHSHVNTLTNNAVTSGAMSANSTHGHTSSYGTSAGVAGTSVHGGRIFAGSAGAYENHIQIGDTKDLSHTHSVTSNVTISNVNNTAADAASAHSVMQPTMVLNYIIKA